MPTAMLHKRRSPASTKKVKPDTSAWNPGVMSENMFALIEYLQKRGDLGRVYSEARPGDPDLTVGAALKDSKDIAVVAGSPEAGNAVLGHEIAHKITKSGYVPRTARIGAVIGNDKLSNYVLPSRWLQQQVGAANVYGSIENLDLRKLLRDTASRRQFEVRGSIPEDEEWSGLTPLTNKDLYKHHDYNDEETKSWYLTDRNLTRADSPMKVASPRRQRAKEYGMFLRDYGVPMNIVAPVVEDMIAAPVQKDFYFGGTADLYRLIQREKK